MNGQREITQQEKQKTGELLQFIQKSPSCYHVVANVCRELLQQGYTQLQESWEWKLCPGGRYFVTRNQSSLIAFRIPEEHGGEQRMETDRRIPGGFLICASHSDSPSFKLKSNYEMMVEDRYVKLNVEKYGGMICSTWMDRPLSVAGRVVIRTRHGIQSILVDLDRDLCLIPNLAIHMNRELNDGYTFNAQKDMMVLFGEAAQKGALAELLTAKLKEQQQEMQNDAENITKEDILGYDLFLYLRESGRIWGSKEEFFSTSKLDDLQCVFASKEAFLQADQTEMIPVLAVFDNEEVGSGTKQGARSTFLNDVLLRIQESFSMNHGERVRQLASSMMLSADNGHAMHPNHPEKSDPTNAPRMNGGILIKYNANQKYTTDGISEAIVKRILERAAVPYQEYTNRSDLAGGSTLGNLSTEQVSINTVDIGAAQLAMHSSYETGGTKDTCYLIQGMKAFYETTLVMEADGNYDLGKAF